MLASYGPWRAISPKLLVIQVLNVYKPRGMTPYGWRKQQERRTVSPVET